MEASRRQEPKDDLVPRNMGLDVVANGSVTPRRADLKRSIEAHRGPRPRRPDAVIRPREGVEDGTDSLEVRRHRPGMGIDDIHATAIPAPRYAQVARKRSESG